MTDRPVAALRRVRPGLRVRRVIAVVIVLVALAVGVDYGAAALTESAVAREMRTQLNLADDPSVRINNFPFLTQALTGRYKSIDVTADHVAVGPPRDEQAPTQLRNLPSPPQALTGRYKSTDVTADQGAVGPLRDVQVRTQLRNVTAPLSQLLGGAP